MHVQPTTLIYIGGTALGVTVLAALIFYISFLIRSATLKIRLENEYGKEKE